MSERGELFSTKIQADERTYFFNVHENFRGETSLNIVESKPTDTQGKFIRQSVIVYEEQLDKFLLGLQSAVDAMHKRQAETERRERAASGTIVKRKVRRKNTDC